MKGSFALLSMMLYLTFMLPQEAKATVMISNPKVSKSIVINQINEFKPHGFRETDYTVYYKITPPKVKVSGIISIKITPPYVSYVIELKKNQNDNSPYINLRESRGLHNGSIANQKEFLLIGDNKVGFLATDTLSSSWKKMNAEVIWGDFNGDFITDILFYPKRTSGVPLALMPTGYTIRLEENYALTKYGPVLESRRPIIIQRIGPDILKYPLYDLAMVRLKDLNNDGRDELIGKTFSNAGRATLYATPNSKGILSNSSMPIGDVGPSNTNDCGINLNLDYSSDYFTNDVCDTVFVLPPVKGVTKTRFFSASSNLNMCRNIKGILSDEQKANQQIASLTQELFNLVERQLQTPTYLKLHKIKEMLEDEVDYLELQVTNAENALEYAKDTMGEIELDFFDGFASQLELDAAELNVNNAENMLERLNYDYSMRVSGLEIADENLNIYVDSIAEQQNSITAAIDNLYFINEKRRKVVAEISKLYGGRLGFSMDTNWTGIINYYAYQNRNANVRRWEKMPLTSGRIISGLPASASEHNGIMWTRLLGMENQNILGGDYYGILAMPGVQNISATPILEEEIRYPGEDVYYGEMALSLGALCEFFPNGKSAIIPPEVNALPQSLSLSMRGNYQLKTDQGIRVAYNLGYAARRIYSHLIKNSSPVFHHRYSFYRYHFVRGLPVEHYSGRYLVDKKKIFNIIRELNESEWFTIRFADSKTSLANQEKIRASVKNQLIDMVFSSIALEHSRFRGKKQNLASTVLIDVSQLYAFIKYNSIWTRADAARNVYINESRYTQYH